MTTTVTLTQTLDEGTEKNNKRRNTKAKTKGLLVMWGYKKLYVWNQHSPENQWLEDKFPSGMAYFRELC